jgi:hypothetical protein
MPRAPSSTPRAAARSPVPLTATLLCVLPDPEKFVNLMMVDELGLEKWDEDDMDGIWKQGLVTMLSFWVFGAIPILGYAIIDAAGVDNQNYVRAPLARATPSPPLTVPRV